MYIYRSYNPIMSWAIHTRIHTDPQIPNFPLFSLFRA